MTHGPEHMSADALTSGEPLSASEWSVLYEAADSGDVEQIIAEARSSGCYERALNAFKRDVVTGESSVAVVLTEAPPLSEKDWGRLLALWLYDVETAHHTLRTYVLVHRILRARPELAAAIAQEGLPLEEEELAAILHDIGKLCIPRSVLNNTLTSADAENILIEKLTQRDPIAYEIVRERLGSAVTAENVHDILEQKHMRPIHVLPLEYVVTQSERTELQLRGFETEGKTLMDIIGQHEEFTGFLLCADHPIASEIAGHHHTPQKSRFTTSAAFLGSTSRISAELVTAVDEIDAISYRRAYKRAEPLTQALMHELRRYQEGALSSFVTYHVLTELVNDIPPEEKEKFPTDMHAITDFIIEYEADLRLHSTETNRESLAA